MLRQNTRGEGAGQLFDDEINCPKDRGASFHRVGVGSRTAGATRAGQRGRHQALAKRPRSVLDAELAAVFGVEVALHPVAVRAGGRAATCGPTAVARIGGGTLFR